MFGSGAAVAEPAEYDIAPAIAKAQVNLKNVRMKLLRVMNLGCRPLPARPP
jgi:hypothetical protein